MCEGKTKCYEQSYAIFLNAKVFTICQRIKLNIHHSLHVVIPKIYNTNIFFNPRDQCVLLSHLGDFICTNVQTIVLFICEMHSDVTELRSSEFIHNNIIYLVYISKVCALNRLSKQFKRNVFQY